jgi:small nuclear ribonucleoprotein (snRNP)-like protein
MSKLDELQGFMTKLIRVKLSDSRVIEGELDCVDKEMNLIISRAAEYHGVEKSKFDCC